MDLLSFDIGGAQREIARRTMKGHIRYVKPDYEFNWHHDLYCDLCDKFLRGEIKKMIISVSPQSGKSEMFTRLLPSRIFGLKPRTKLLCCTYNATKAEEFNRDVQRYLELDSYKELYPDVRLNRAGTNGVDVRNSEKFDIPKWGGFMKVAGVGGGITGTPCDVLIIDDPVKGREEADSPQVLDNIWDWYNSEAVSRLHNDSQQLIIMTRWDTRDLVGRILECIDSGGMENDWVVVTLPAIREVDDGNPFDPRKVGEALWPQRHSVETLLERKKMDKRAFESLYQQKPMPVQTGGEAYKDFDRTVHVLSGLEYNPDLPLHVSFDFNVNPYMPAIVCQVEPYSSVGSDGSMTRHFNVNIIREYTLRSPKNTTEDVCNAILHDYAGHVNGLYIYGDPRGIDRDTRLKSGHNDYTIILRMLSRFKPSLRILKKADHVKTRLSFANAVFASGWGGLVVRVDSSCVKTIEDFQYIKEDSDGSKVKVMFNDPISGQKCQRWGHLSDAWDYFLPVAFRSLYDRFINDAGTNYKSRKIIPRKNGFGY